MKNLYLISIFLLLFFLNLGCGNSTKENDSKSNNSENNSISDLKTSGKIDEYCLNVEKEISSNTLQLEQFNTSCTNLLTEIYFTKFVNSSGELIKIETTTSSEDFYLMEDFYFENNKIVEKYYYFETYQSGESSADEKINYFTDEKILKITEKTGKGIDIDKAYQQFEKCAIKETEIKNFDNEYQKKELTFIKSVKSATDLDSWYCVAED